MLLNKIHFCNRLIAQELEVFEFTITVKLALKKFQTLKKLERIYLLKLVF